MQISHLAEIRQAYQPEHGVQCLNYMVMYDGKKGGLLTES